LLDRAARQAPEAPIGSVYARLGFRRTGTARIVG
jgi:hypothetical protein